MGTGRASTPIGIDLDAPWSLHPSVSVRPEPFGALLYHFGNRRLSFLKDRRLLDVVRRLDTAPSARAALDDAGVPAAEQQRFATALQTLSDSEIVVRRDAHPDEE